MRYKYFSVGGLLGRNTGFVLLLCLSLAFSGCFKSASAKHEKAEANTDSDTDTDVDTCKDEACLAPTDDDTVAGSDTDTDSSTDTAASSNCPRYVTSVADCPYQLYIGEDNCPAIRCLDAPCAFDADCPDDGAPYCVTGNCAFCREDTACTGGERCRGGRCVVPDTDACPETPSCTNEGCRLLTLSEDPCPVCICDGSSMQSTEPCEADADCHGRWCVNGRCVECRNDGDCTKGLIACMTPGFCRHPNPHVSKLYGPRLVGWSGGLNHMSYMRFEPDGTVRRGNFESDAIWKDDFPLLLCAHDETFPMLGAWHLEPLTGNDVQLIVSLNTTCDGGEGFHEAWYVNNVGDDGWIIFGGETGSFDAVPVHSTACTPAFDTCELPRWDF